MTAQRTIALPERYRVESRIASGGMASVWEAWDELLRRRVAVKVLSSMSSGDEQHRARFQREAHATARMSDCTHVVTIYDVGEHAGHAYIVMELFENGTVADRLREPGLVERATALRWVREAAIALDCAHGHGVVHRDIKPANLLLDADDRLAVADFGIAQLSDATRQLTATGTVLGTAAYLSPEQALGEPASEASDRYGLAVVAWELLTGERPYRAEHFAAQARQHVEAPVPMITERTPELPVGCDRLFIHALAKDPADRPASAMEFVDELERALSGAPQKATPTVPQFMRELAGSRRAAAPRAEGAPRRRERSPRAAPRPPTAPRAAPAPAPAPPQPRRARSRRVPAILAAAAAVGGAGAALALAMDGDEEPQRRAQATPTATAQRTATTRATATSPAAPETAPEATPETTPETTPPTASTTPSAPAADGRSPAQLNDAGYALIQREQYGEAVPLLQRSVEGFRSAGQTGELGYAFALYNLAYALARTGQEDQAVPLLEERLRISDNQRGVVRRELERIQGGKRRD